MSKQKTHKSKSIQRSQSEPAQSPRDSLAAGQPSRPTAFAWSRAYRRIASIAIAAYLIVLLVGPLSNPIGSPHFSTPIAALVAPIHRVLFLGHGYRFFAPDPGNSHRLLYHGVRPDGTEFSGHLPSREDHWPRLMYHRWFMLSETMFNEHRIKPTESQFKQRESEYEKEILRLRTAGKRKLLKQLLRERELESEFYTTTTERADLLAQNIARVLMTRNGGESIELFVQERRIPFPEEVADGLTLESESLLSTPLKIGELDSSGFRAFIPVETLPSQEVVQ